MKINFNMTRFALAAYARKTGRPDYSIAVMCDVHSAIINDVDHHLKSIVLENLEAGKNYRDEIKNTQEEDRVQSLMFRVNEIPELRPILAQLMDVPVSQVVRHMTGNAGLSIAKAEEYWAVFPQALAVLGRTEKMDKILFALKDRPNCKFRELLKASGLAKGTVRQYLITLEHRRLIVKKRSGEGAHYLYSLSEIALECVA